MLSRACVEEILNQVQNDNEGFYFEMERRFTMDRKKLEETILAKAKDGKIPCAMCFKIADDFGISKREIGKILNEINVRINQCQLGCFE